METVEPSAPINQQDRTVVWEMNMRTVDMRGKYFPQQGHPFKKDVSDVEST